MKNLVQDINRAFRHLRLRWKIRREFSRFFNIARELQHLGVLEVGKVHWNEGQIHFYSVNILSQSLHKLESICTLVERGLTADAWPIVRSLIESVLDHDYILRNPDKLDLYFKYSAYLDIRLIQRIAEGRQLTKEEEIEFSKIKAEWEKHKSLFQTKNGIRNAWRDKSLEEIGKEIKLTNIYSSVYREASDYVHSNSNLIRHYIVGKSDKGLLLRAGGVFNKREIILITSVSLVLVFVALHRANKYFKLEFNRDIELLDKKIVKFHSTAKEFI